MGMKIENQFHVPLPREQAWQLLLDTPRLVACLPGARLTRVIDEKNFEGAIDVKLGPMTFSFGGAMAVTEIDLEAWRMCMHGSGREQRARGNAEAQIDLQVFSESDILTRVEIGSDIVLSGQVAQYGRGVGMIKAVADEIVKRFAANLRTEIERGALAAASAAPVALSIAVPAAPAPAAAPGLSMGSLLWSMFSTWLRGLFGRKA